MTVSNITTAGWVFLVSLTSIGLGALGWYFNRSLVELRARLDRDEEAPKFSTLQAWFLPKYRTGAGRLANADFHEHVDLKAKNRANRFFLAVIIAGAVVQIGLWSYMMNFGEVPLLRSLD